MLADSGFRECVWEDRTAVSLVWFERVRAGQATRPSAGAGTPALGLHLLLGAKAGERLRNVPRNLAEDRLRLVWGVLAS